MGSVDSVADVLEHCQDCGAFEEAPRIPIAGTSAALASNEKLRADLLFSDHAIALHAAGVSSKYPLWVPARFKNSKAKRGVFRSSRSGIFAGPKCIRMDGGGLMNSNGFEMHSNANGWLRSAFEWETAIRADFCAGRRVEVQFQGASARTWLHGEMGGLARGAYEGLAAGDRFPNKQILMEARYFQNILFSARGHSATCTGGGGDDGGLLSAEDTPLPGLFAQQWQLRVTAQGAAPAEFANSKLRRLQTRNNPFNCADAKVGHSALPHKAANR